MAKNINMHRIASHNFTVRIETIARGLGIKTVGQFIKMLNNNGENVRIPNMGSYRLKRPRIEIEQHLADHR